MRLTRKARIARLIDFLFDKTTNRDRNDLSSFNPSFNRLNKRILKKARIEKICDFFNLGPSEIRNRLKEANSSKKQPLKDEEILLLAIEIVTVFEKGNIWYSCYLVDNNNDLADLTTQQHRLLTRKYYTPSVVVQQVIISDPSLTSNTNVNLETISIDVDKIKQVLSSQCKINFKNTKKEELF